MIRGARVRILAAAIAAALVLPIGARAVEPLIERFATTEQTKRSEGLLSHGINLNEPALLGFLVNGFPSGVAGSLPDTPPVKTEVVNYAIQELGLRQSQMAVEPLAQIAEGNLTPGLQSILSRDTERVPIDGVDRLRSFYASFLQVNAIVALGMIGDESVAPRIEQVARSTQLPSVRVECAVTLGLLNSPAATGQLALLARDPSDAAFAQAFDAVYWITGRNYGVSDQTSTANRRRIAEEFRAWFDREGAKLTPRRDDILRRRFEGVMREEPGVQSLRGALRASRNVEKFDVRYAGRERLRQLGPGAADELRAIAADPLEDLDIRRAALQWYAASDPKAAKKLMKDVAKKDEDEVIRRQAEVLLPEIDRALKGS